MRDATNNEQKTNTESKHNHRRTSNDNYNQQTKEWKSFRIRNKLIKDA